MLASLGGPRHRAAAAPTRDVGRSPFAVALRDAAILELLYATGIRVSELCGLDTGALDLGRRTVRVFGKGGKERTVPVGIPAVRAVGQWQQAGRPVLLTPASGQALFLGARGGRIDPRTARRVVHERLRAAGVGAEPGRTGCGTPPPPTCSKAAPTCAACRRCSGTPRWPPPRSTPTSRPTGSRPATARPTPAPEPGPGLPRA